MYTCITHRYLKTKLQFRIHLSRFILFLCPESFHDICKVNTHRYFSYFSYREGTAWWTCCKTHPAYRYRLVAYLNLVFLELDYFCTLSSSPAHRLVLSQQVSTENRSQTDLKVWATLPTQLHSGMIPTFSHFFCPTCSGLHPHPWFAACPLG